MILIRNPGIKRMYLHENQVIIVVVTTKYLVVTTKFSHSSEANGAVSVVLTHYPRLYEALNKRSLAIRLNSVITAIPKGNSQCTKMATVVKC